MALNRTVQGPSTSAGVQSVADVLIGFLSTWATAAIDLRVSGSVDYQIQAGPSAIYLYRWASGSAYSLGGSGSTGAHYRFGILGSNIRVYSSPDGLVWAKIADLTNTVVSAPGDVIIEQQATEELYTTRDAVVVTGLPTGYYARLSDGTNNVDAAASGGTATLSPSVAQWFGPWPLSIYDGNPSSGGVKQGASRSVFGGDSWAYSVDIPSPLSRTTPGGLATRFPNLSDTVGLWKCLDGAGTTVVDTTANARNLTMLGGSSLGSVGGAPDLISNGTTIGAHVLSSPLTAVSNFTLEAVFKLGTLPGNGADAMIAYNGTDSGGYGLLVRGTAGGTAVFGSLYGGTVYIIPSDTPVLADTWYYAALVRESGGTTRIYLNALVSATTSNNAPLSIPARFTILGRYWDLTSTASLTPGTVAGVRISNTAHAAAAITSTYAALRANVTVTALPAGYYARLSDGLHTVDAAASGGSATLSPSSMTGVGPWLLQIYNANPATTGVQQGGDEINVFGGDSWAGSEFATTNYPLITRTSRGLLNLIGA